MTDTPDKAYKGKCKCFLVWSPDGTHEPTKIHETHKSALREAYRMSALFPGREFYVLMQASRACVTVPESAAA